jgi:hypothetical protein
MSNGVTITFENSGNFTKTLDFLKGVQTRSENLARTLNLDKYGQMGVDALSAATPVDTGLTASSWGYEIVSDETGVSLWWTNSNVVDDDGELIPVVILLQYGHMTQDHKYFIRGIDFINPALAPVFEQIADDAWEEVVG